MGWSEENAIGRTDFYIIIIKGTTTVFGVFASFASAKESFGQTPELFTFYAVDLE